MAKISAGILLFRRRPPDLEVMLVHPGGAHKQPGGKIVVAWAHEGDFDPALLKSNTFAIEWPPRSGKTAEFPEVDRAAWYSIDEALEKINNGQKPIVAALRVSAIP